MKIAILDDNRAFAGVLKEILVFKGHNVKAFYSGIEMLNDKFLKQYDMIIIDLYLPDQFGLSIIKELKEANINASIIVSSVDFSDNVLKKLKEIGIRHFLKKPFNFEDLNKIMLSIEKVELLIDDFIKKQKDGKDILLLTDGANYKILHNLKHFTLNEFKAKMEELDESETCIIDKMSANDLSVFLSEVDSNENCKKAPKVIILLREDLTRFRKMLSEKPEAKDIIIEKSFVIDLKFVMS